MNKAGRTWAFEVGTRRFERSSMAGRVRYGATGDAVAEVEVRMPPRALLGELAQPDAVCRLLVGYAATGPIEVASGQVVYDSVESRQTAERPYVRWSVAIGAGALRTRGVSLSLRGPATTADVLEQLRVELGLAAGVIAPGAPMTYQRGYYSVGPVSVVLDAICGDADSRWTLDGGVLRVWPRQGEALVTATRLAAATGLLESATTAGGREVTARCLLEPHIRRGDVVSLESQTASGLLVVEEVGHTWDTSGAAWYTDIRGRWRR